MKKDPEDTAVSEQKLNEKLFRIKQKIGIISKNRTNPYHKSKYFDINLLLHTLEPLLIEEKLLLTQPLRGNKVYSIITDMDTQHITESYLELLILENPQKMGSAITYYRRYTLQSLLALEAKDDDGNLASIPTPKPIKKPELLIMDTKGKNFTNQWLNIIECITDSDNTKIQSIKDIEKYYTIDEVVKVKLNELLNTN